MQLARNLFAMVGPAAIAVTALLHAQAIGALVEATADATVPTTVAIAAPSPAAAGEKSADAIVARNPFEHARPALADASACDDVRALVTVRGEDQSASLVALDVAGARLLRRRGGVAGNMQVTWIGADRAWLARGDRVCEVRVFVHPEPKRAPATPPSTAGIERAGPTELAIDRGILDRLLDTPAELAKVRVVPDARGVRLAKVPRKSAVAALGLEDGDVIVSALGVDVTRPEKVLELYARLRTGTLSRVTLSILRKGQPMTLDYVVR